MIRHWRFPAWMAIAIWTAAIPTSHAQQNGSTLPDACALLTEEEIGTAIGTTVRSSQPRSVPEGSECLYQTRADIMLKISVSPVSAQDFDELRELFGVDAEVVPDLGDAAYYLENDRIYMRVGMLQFVVNRGEPGDASFREALLTMARIAEPRLK